MTLTDPSRRAAAATYVLSAAVALLATGCSGDTVRVTGRLVKDGKPYTANLEGAEPETFALDFVGTINGRKLVIPATLNADGTFTVGAAKGSGIPRGQYRITVLHSGFLGAGGDRLKSRFAADKTPLTIDV